MDRNAGSFTVLFQPPFWVGIAQRWDETGYSAAKVTFGAQPTDAQLYEWLLREWHKLQFSPAAKGEFPVLERKNPKRVRREAREATRTRGVSTHAQEVLSRQREQEGLARQAQRRQRRQEGAEQKYLLRRQKKRAKKRGR